MTLIYSFVKQLPELSRQTSWPTSSAASKRTTCLKSSASWGDSIVSLNSASCSIKTSSCRGHRSWRCSGKWEWWWWCWYVSRAIIICNATVSVWNIMNFTVKNLLSANLLRCQFQCSTSSNKSKSEILKRLTTSFNSFVQFLWLNVLLLYIRVWNARILFYSGWIDLLIIIIIRNTQILNFVVKYKCYYSF